MIGWCRRRREERRLIKIEAEQLIARHGYDAYAIASERMVETSFARNNDANARWTRIREEIRRQLDIPADRVDTATRYLERR